MRKVVVVGGGPAGMMAAIAAARAGASVALLEKNEKLGKKLYITGKGRCNVTNAAEREEFLRHIPRGGRFFQSSFSAFDNAALCALLEPLVPLKTERGRRVFPRSDKASDITRALQTLMERAGAEARLGVGVTGVCAEGGRIRAVLTPQGEIRLDALVLATGGFSYPATGSTGDALRFAESLGHALVPASPSLIPFETEQDWPAHLQGLTLKNVELCAQKGKKVLFRERGEMMMTHFGVGGPLVLEMSAYLPDELGGIEVWLDMKPALSPEQVQARILREAEGKQRSRLSTLLETLLPSRMAPEFAGICGIDPALPVSQLSREQRRRLAETLKRVPLRLKARRPLEEAVITRGGVALDEVQPRTMASKKYENLFFAGEMLDIDACTGGYNLQIAFSTGYAAGKAAAAPEP